MDFDHVKEFIDLTQTGRFSITAEKYKTNRSTITRHIQQLEYELGVTLFKRSTHSLELTDAGEIFLDYARRIIAEYDRYKNTLSSGISYPGEKLTIGITISISDDFISFINEFNDEHPEIITITKSDYAHTLIESIKRKKIDAAFIPDYQWDIDSGFTLFEDHFVAVLPKDHPLAGQKQISLPELQNEFIIHFDAPFNDKILNACKDAGFEPKIKEYNMDAANIIKSVAKNQGIALLMDFPTRKRDTSDVAILDIYPPITYEYKLVYLKDAASPALDAFISYVRENLDSVLKSLKEN